ncbi:MULTISPECIES: hypothetical protein [unclassified Microbacterium]
MPPTGVEPATYGTNVRMLTPKIPAEFVHSRADLAPVTPIGERVA